MSAQTDNHSWQHQLHMGRPATARIRSTHLASDRHSWHLASDPRSWQWLWTAGIGRPPRGVPALEGVAQLGPLCWRLLGLCSCTLLMAAAAGRLHLVLLLLLVVLFVAALYGCPPAATTTLHATQPASFSAPRRLEVVKKRWPCIAKPISLRNRPRRARQPAHKGCAELHHRSAGGKARSPGK
jgi:hypothetical protein